MENKSEKTADRLSMIDRWKASGKSINAFCKEENISYHMFLYWKNKQSKQSNSNGFIKIKASERIPTNDSTCEIIFANGNRINFNIRPEVNYLKGLLT